MIKIGLPQIKVGKEKTNWLFLSILGALMAVISLATDIYLPAMPKMHQMSLILHRLRQRHKL